MTQFQERGWGRLTGALKLAPMGAALVAALARQIPHCAIWHEGAHEGRPYMGVYLPGILSSMPLT